MPTDYPKSLYEVKKGNMCYSVISASIVNRCLHIHRRDYDTQPALMQTCHIGERIQPTARVRRGDGS